MVDKTERHVRCNWEKSPDDSSTPVDIDGLGLMRYHFVVVDDRDREGVLLRILDQMQQFGDLIPVRNVEGKVAGTRFRYLFRSYDSTIAPRELNLNLFRKPVIKDSELRERKKSSEAIEDYVANIYNPE